MATLEKIRNRAGLLVAVIIGLALVAFILQDFLGGKSSMFKNSDIEIAEVAGKSVPYKLYQDKIDNLVELNKALSGKSAIDEQTTEQIREEVWNEIVRENVLGKNLEDLSLIVSTDELFDMVQGNNIHPFVRQQFANRQTGEFDKNFVIQFLKNMDSDASGVQKSFWLYLEELMKRDKITSKYNSLIKQGMFITDLQLKRSINDRSKKVDVNFIVKRYTTIPDSTVMVDQKEIKAYYDKHKSEFEQKASRDIEYVMFPVSPSADDFQIAEKWINGILPDFAKASDAGQFVNLNSDTPFNSRYLSQKDIINPEMSKWAFDAKVGEMFGPAFDGNSFQLAKLQEVVSISDSVKARHILIGFNSQTQVAKDSAKAMADSLLKVVKKGESFVRLASKFSSDPGSASKGGDLGWFAEGTMVKPFNDACFNEKKGDIVLVETQFGFHIIEILDKSKPSKKVQVAILERNVVASTRTYQHVYSQASEFAGVNNTYDKFNEALQNNKKVTKRLASNLKENDKKIAGLDNAREMIRWSFTAKKHEVSTVFEFGSNFVVATLAEVREEGFAPLTQVADDIKTKVLRDKKADIIIADFNKLITPESNLDNLAQAVGVAQQNAVKVSMASFSLPSAGFEPVVIANAVEASEGKLVGPIKGNTGIYALTVTAVNTEEVEKDAEYKRMLNGLQSRANFEPYEAQKKKANIIDKRAKYF